MDNQQVLGLFVILLLALAVVQFDLSRSTERRLRGIRNKLDRVDVYRVDERVHVTLFFESVAEKNYFMGGLSDGWGENECDLEWNYDVGFEHATQFFVKPFHDDHEEEEEDG